MNKTVTITYFPGWALLFLRAYVLLRKVPAKRAREDRETVEEEEEEAETM